MFKRIVILVCFFIIVVLHETNGNEDYRSNILNIRNSFYSNPYNNQSVDFSRAKELGIIRKRRGSRRGNTHIAISFTNCNGRAKMLADPKSSYLSKYSFIFLCETWVTQQKFTPADFPKKSNFVHHAKKAPGPGRPSGGHEWYANPV